MEVQRKVEENVLGTWRNKDPCCVVESLVNHLHIRVSEALDKDFGFRSVGTREPASQVCLPFMSSVGESWWLSIFSS